MDMSRIRQILPGAVYNIIEDDKKDLLKEDALLLNYLTLQKVLQLISLFT